MLIEQLSNDLVLVQDSQDINAIYDYFGVENDGEFGCLFVEVADGDYGQVYGCRRSVPLLTGLAVDFRAWYSL